MTPDYWENVMNILIEKYELSKTDLWDLSIVVSKRTFWKYLDEWKNDGKIKIREDKNEKLVSLSDSNKGLALFLNNFGMELNEYEKLLKKNLKQLKNNLPLIHVKMPMKSVKTREGVLELDKKRNVWRDMGKTQAGHAMTWNCRKKPLQHFEAIMSILHQIYQRSSALNYNIGLNISTSLMKKYQKKSDKMINDTADTIEAMFKGKTDSAYTMYRLQATLSGIIYQNTMKNNMKNA